MIPILFKENETNFNTNGIAVLDETIDYIVTEERNGLFDLELEYPASGRWLKEFKDFRLISAKPNDEDESHLFRIYEIVKSLETQTIRVYASTRSNDLGGNMVSNVEVKNATAQDALNKMKVDLIEPTNYNFVSDIQIRSSTQWIRRNPLNCIAGEEGSMVQYWGGELKRTNDTIFLYSRRGRDRVTEICPGKNLEGFTMTTSTKGMITRILPYITFVPEGKQDEVTLIGSIVNSPLMDNYPVKYIVPVDYSGDQEITSLTQLNNAAKDYFAYQNPGCDKPNVTLDIDLMQLSDSSEYSKFKDLEHIALTDTVVVWVEKYDVDVEVKVNEVSYSGMMGQVTNIVAGNQKHGLYDDVKHDYKSSFNELQKYVSGMENGIRNTIQLTADGKNRIFRGYTEPDISLSKENDLWYKQLGSGEVEVYIFDGAYWQPLITAGLNEAVKAEVRKMLDQAEADRLAAEQGIADAITAANEYADQQVIEFDEKVNAVRLDATDAVTKADGALAKAEQAILDAGFAKTDAGTAKTNAANALTTAGQAKTNADSALSKIGAVEVTTGNLQVSYDQLNTSVGLKADKSIVDGINQTVAQQSIDIKAATDGLTLKADSSFVNQLKNTVDTHTTQIGVNSTAISARLTSAQVETLLTGKKYVNETTLTATASGLNASITQVSTDLSNLEIGGRNLIVSATLLFGRYLIETNGTIASAASHTATDFIPVVGSQSYILSADILHQIRIVYYDVNKAYIGGYLWSGAQGTSKIINTPSNARYVRWSGDHGNGSDLRTWKFEKGTKATDWTPAPEDMATLEQFTTIDATVKGLQTTVGNKAEQSQVTQLAGQISSKVESATYNSKMTQLDSAISSKVASTTYESKMTQLDNAINLRVVQKDVTDAILADKTIKDTRNDNQTPLWYTGTYPRQEVREFKLRTVLGLPGSSTYVQLTTKIPWAGGTSGGVPVQVAVSNDGTYQRSSNATMSGWLAWDKIAEAGKLLSQINLSTEGVLIQGKRIQLDGDVTMTAAYVNILNAKTLDAITANITTIRSKVLTTDVVLSTHIKSDTALITKLFATDANVGVLTAKTAFVNAIKATTIAADKITGGTLNGNNMTVINIAASAINANTLSAITANTGALNVSGWLTMSTENKGILGEYDYGDKYGEAYNFRWFTGDYRLSHRHLIFSANSYDVTTSNTKGGFKYYTESFYGPDYVKLRQLNYAKDYLHNRIDINADRITMSKDYTSSNIVIASDGSGFFSGDVQINGDLRLTTTKALKAYHLLPPDAADNIYINEARTELGAMRFGKDGSSINSGRVIISHDIYKRTYSNTANVVVNDTGVIGRSVSARKYKENIRTESLIDIAKRTLSLSPSSWHDKGDIESIAKCLTEDSIDELDSNHKIQRYYGFIADEFDEVGATEVVSYDSNGEVEGLAYDRISMYHHELIKDLYKKIEKLESELNERTSN